MKKNTLHKVMATALVGAMAMSLVFYILDKFGLTNDQSQK